MAFPAYELPADNVIQNPSLFDTKETAEKDEWVGELYLEVALALLLLRRKSSSEDIISLKESLPAERMAFRHDNLCRQLRKNEVRLCQSSELGYFQGHSNFQKESLAWIGAIRRRGTSTEQQILDSAIVENLGPNRSPVSSQSIVANPVQSGLAVQDDLSGEDSASADSDSELWRYTKLLQERFAGKSVVPVYQDLTLRGYPAKFQSEVMYRGKKFSATAGNKKLAKHRSSKKLCMHLGMKVAGV